MVKDEMRNKIRIMASKVLVTAMLITCMPEHVYAAETIDDDLRMEEPAAVESDTLYEGPDELLEETEEAISREEIAENVKAGELLGDNEDENEKDNAEAIIPYQNETYSEERVKAEYLNYSGQEISSWARALDGSETTLNGDLYIVQGSLNYTHGITISGTVNIILADGCELTFGTEENPLSCNAISGGTLYILGQKAKTGRMSVNVCCVDEDYDAIDVQNYYQWGGNVSVSCKSKDGIHHGDAIHSSFLLVNGRSLDAICDGSSTAAVHCSGTVVINGGIINAVNSDNHGILLGSPPINISFSGREADEHITVSSYYCDNPSSNNPYVSLSQPLVEFDDHGNICNTINKGVFFRGEEEVFAGKTLYPAFQIMTDNEYITISGDVLNIENDYYAMKGAEVCLGYTGDMPDGYEVSEYILGDRYGSSVYARVPSNGLFNMPNSSIWVSDVTFTITDIEYIDADGVTRNISDDPDIVRAKLLTGREGGLEEGWYVAFGNIESAPQELSGKVNIIIADDSTLNFGSSTYRRNYSAFCSANSINNGEYTPASLNIYGQTKRSGALNIYCTNHPAITVDGTVGFYGGNVNCDCIDDNSTSYSAVGIHSGGSIDISKAKVNIETTRAGIEAGGDIKIRNGSTVTVSKNGSNQTQDADYLYAIYGEKSIYVSDSKLSQYNKYEYYADGRGAYFKGHGEIINSELAGHNLIIDSDITIKNSRVDCDINGRYYQKDPSYDYYNIVPPKTVTSNIKADHCSGVGSICGVTVSANDCTGGLGFEARDALFIGNCDLSDQEEGEYHNISGEDICISDSEINGHYMFKCGNISLSRNKIQLTLASSLYYVGDTMGKALLEISGTAYITDCEFMSEGAVKGNRSDASRGRLLESDLYINNSKFIVDFTQYVPLEDGSVYLVNDFGDIYVNDSEVSVLNQKGGAPGLIQALGLYLRNSKLTASGGGKGVKLTDRLNNGINGCLYIDKGSEVLLQGYADVIGDIIVNGGKVGGGINLRAGKILLGWSDRDDLIRASSCEDYVEEWESSAQHNYDDVVHIMKGKRFIVYSYNYDYETGETIILPEGIIGSLTEETVLNEEQNKALWTKSLRPFGYSVTVSGGVIHGVEPTVIDGKEYYLYFDDEACVLKTSVPATGMKKITTTSGTVMQTGNAGEFMLSGIDDDATVSADAVTLTVDDIADQSYAGAPVEPALTVRDGEKVLTEGVDYTVSYSDNVLPGIATATIAGKGAYFGSFTKSFNIVNRTVTVTAKDQRVAVGTGIGSGADMVTAAGLAEVHYIATATITSSQGTSALGDYDGDLVPSSVTIKDADGADVTQYYSITYAAGTLSVTKAQAKITTQPYAKTGLKYTGTALELVSQGTSSEGTVQYSTDYDPDDESGTWSADIPVKTGAGSYEVYYKVTGNNEHEDSNVAGPISVSISKTPLTVTAKSKTITYGDTPDNDGVEYSGFVNGETETVLGGSLTYDYGYSQYGDVGSTYTITPGGYKSDNYDISYSNGTLTVSEKEIGLNWSNAALTYNGRSQAPAASATGLVNGDEVTVTVTGAQTNAGKNYTVAATGLQGAKAGNYKLPADKTKTFEIGRASHGDVTAEGSAKYGCGGSVELASLIETGASTGAVTVTDNDGIIEGTPVVSNNVLSFVLTDDAAGVGKSATVSINVTGALNYTDYAIIVTLNVIDCSHEHTTVRDIRKATCTEKGYTGDTYCTDCGALISRGKDTPVDPDNHDYDYSNGKITKEPTAFTMGEHTYYCRHDHSHTITKQDMAQLKADDGGDYSDFVNQFCS